MDYKRGKRPHVAAVAYDPERVHICAQGLLLREHGFEYDSGVLYFAGSKERVPVVHEVPMHEVPMNFHMNEFPHGQSAILNVAMPPVQLGGTGHGVLRVNLFWC